MPISRRNLLIAGAAAALLPNKTSRADSSIDRQKLIRRHNPVIGKFDPFSALTVGNGNFAFTSDFTGLQTFTAECDKLFPLCTCAHWAWHTTPMPADLRNQKLRLKYYDTYGRKVGYPTESRGQEALFNWLRENPHRLHLGRIALVLTHEDASPAQISDIQNCRQELDLWTGRLASQFVLDGIAVSVQTCCDPDRDALAVRIQSPLLSSGRLKVLIAFPYASPAMDMADWNSPQKHETDLSLSANSAIFSRQLDQTRYCASLSWESGKFERIEKHKFLLNGSGDQLDFVITFSPSEIGPPSTAETGAIFRSSSNHWQNFWSTGAAMDLSSSTDPRAEELERRIVLSQLNTAVNCAGPIPPQETGLLFNTWYGKAHLEMHWWHGVHFAAWNRIALFERSLDYYQRILPKARSIAQEQGYAGVRWPKMVGPNGEQSPSPIAPLLIWQQPHPIYYAELCFQNRPDASTLSKWREIVFESANFMASFAVLDGDRYVLGPPMKPVPENTDTNATKNTTFELNYWRFGLTTAQLWRKRLGMPPDPRWADVLNRLAQLPQADGRYLMMEGMTDTYTKWNWEHPSLLGAFGMQPGFGVDAATMRRSLQKITEVWQWDRCWGWDFPMAALTAARLGECRLAVDCLLIESIKNRYLPNGHVYQRPNLPAYLPANGGLLAAAAAIGLQKLPAGSGWSIRSEGLRPLL